MYPVTALLPFAWLISTAKQPWLSFSTNAVAAGIVLFGALQLLRSRSKNVNATDAYSEIASAIGVLIFSFYILFAPDLTDGSPDRAAIALWTIFIIGVSVWIGYSQRHQETTATLSPGYVHNIKPTPPKRTPIDLLMLTILGVSVVNVAIQLVQWTGLEELFNGWIRKPMPGGMRPFANIGQPNILATTLIWGLVASLWLGQRGILRTYLCWILGITLSIGLGFTQSRTGILSLIIICFLGIVFIHQKLVKVQLICFTAICVALAYTLPWVSHHFATSIDTEVAKIALRSADFSDASSIGIRLDVWKNLVSSIPDFSIWGSGLNSTGMRHLDVYSQDAPWKQQVLFVYAHNLLIDLLLWFGPVLVSLTAVFCIFLLYRFSTGKRTTEQWLLFLFLLPFFLHSLLEFPYAYISLTAVAGVVLGMLLASVLDEPKSAGDQKFKLPVKVLVFARHGIFSYLLLALISAYGGALIVDYSKLRTALAAIQFEARFVTPPPSSELNPSFLVFRDWGPWLQLNRKDFSFGCESVSHLENSRLIQVLQSYPTPNAVARVAYCLDYSGNFAEAKYWRERICALSNPISCAHLTELSRPNPRYLMRQ